MDRSGWDPSSWVDQELAGPTFKDERLGRRPRKLLVQMADAVGALAITHIFPRRINALAAFPARSVLLC